MALRSRQMVNLRQWNRLFHVYISHTYASSSSISVTLYIMINTAFDAIACLSLFASLAIFNSIHTHIGTEMGTKRGSIHSEPLHLCFVDSWLRSVCIFVNYHSICMSKIGFDSYSNQCATKTQRIAAFHKSTKKYIESTNITSKMMKCMEFSTYSEVKSELSNSSNLWYTFARCSTFCFLMLF